MPTPRFIQVHSLVTYTAVLLNRDDSGMAKRLPYGGVQRTRISSQCLKRHWRKADGEYALTNIEPDPVRTRELAERAIMSRVGENLPSLDQETKNAVLDALNQGLYGKDGQDAKKRQPLLFGEPEINHLVNRVTEILSAGDTGAAAQKAVGELFTKEEKQNFAAFRQSATMPAGLIGAMFGRMVTADPAANIDAAVSVAHAFTVHEEETETDYFTAMEDLPKSDEHGAGHIGETEINSGIYYVYACIEVPVLVSNTTGDKEKDWLTADRSIAAEAAANLVGLVATVSPGAKRGSTAPYGYSHAMVVEAGERQPRTLAEAYQEAAKPTAAEATARMTAKIAECDRIYGEHEARRHFGLDSGQDSKLEEISGWVRSIVLKGAA